eukprot:TRINITY_DN33899_c1_g1_i1.p1 TRINITY_DN33899_c1_g1~~TRINITY_DN33899_c1_g1_i1.p1  ORF type:complete len:310 (+),score=32.89 TRINITY_DN33899_c1_g1_i1:217-1146(+)
MFAFLISYACYTCVTKMKLCGHQKLIFNQMTEQTHFLTIKNYSLHFTLLYLSNSQLYKMICTKHPVNLHTVHTVKLVNLSSNVTKSKLQSQAMHDDLISIAIPAAAFAGISISGLRLIVENGQKIGKLEEGDNVKWSVMGVISCIPYLNYLAWIFGALEDEQNKNIYYAYAALYFLPWIKQGFEFDFWQVWILALGIVHVQVERLVITEPQQTSQKLENFVGNLNILKQISSKFSSVIGSVKDGFYFSRNVRQQLGDDSRLVEKQLKDDQELKSKLEFEKSEQELFDQQLSQRQKMGRDDSSAREQTRD